MLVSICCLAYNHAAYIRECLDGFLMQRTDFPVEIIVHDDASTDGTQDILREYQARYPDRFHLILQTENQYSKGVNVAIQYIFPRVRGKYIAFCEGDDYWTDPDKLQKQVDFLEAHPDHSMCCHATKQYMQNEHLFTINETQKKLENKNFTFDCQRWTELVGLFQTSSVIIRVKCLDIGFLQSFKKSKDTHLFYSILENGKGYFFKDTMSVYRITGNGVWTSLPPEKRIFEGILTTYEIYQRRRNKFTKKWACTNFGELILFYLRIDKHPIKVLGVFPMIIKYYGYMGIWYTFLFIYKRMINYFFRTIRGWRWIRKSLRTVTPSNSF